MAASVDGRLSKAPLWKSQPDGSIRCQACSHRCLIKPGRQGICRVRQNFVGDLYSLGYGRTINRNVDPIEKKPLYHVRPKSRSYSVAAPPCRHTVGWDPVIGAPARAKYKDLDWVAADLDRYGVVAG